jgi:hydrogenase expression/formation protein HypC
MCHALPVKIVALTGPDTAKVSLGGIVKEVSVALIDDPQPGDYVVLHVGYALARIDEAEAERTLALLAAERSDAVAEFANAAEAIAERA